MEAYKKFLKGALYIHVLAKPINTADYADYSILHNLYTWACIGLIN